MKCRVVDICMERTSGHGVVKADHEKVAVSGDLVTISLVIHLMNHRAGTLFMTLTLQPLT